MAAIQLSGLASGFDWKSFVDQLMTVEAVPQDNLRTEKTKLTVRQNAFDTLKSNLTTLESAAKALSGDSLFSARTAAVADITSGWSASADSGAEIGSHKLTVMQLATKAQRLGIADSGAPLSMSSDVSGVSLSTIHLAVHVTAGDFTVNGQKVSIALTDSLQDVFQKINTATSGAVAGSYDPATDRIKLSSGSEIILGSANDTSNFLTAAELYNNGTGEILPPHALGTVSTSAAVKDANLRAAVTNVDGSGNGVFSINDVEIAFNVNTDSIQAIMQRVNTSAAGVTLSFDRTSDRFTLTNKVTGDTGIGVSESAGGLLEALGLNTGSTLARGKNASFSIDDGAPLTSTSNTLDESAHGVPGLSITAASESTQTITVSQDSTSSRKAIEDFIAKYNAAQKTIDDQTRTTVSSTGKVTTSTFSGDREISDIATKLRSIVFGTVSGLSGTVQRLESIGIDFKTGSSELEIKDSSKLDQALLKDSTDVDALLNTPSTGIISQLTSFVARVTGTTGMITVAKDNIAKQTRSIDTQISDWDRKLSQQRDTLVNSFIQMEKMQSAIQAQLSLLSNAFPTSGSSSSAK